MLGANAIIDATDEKTINLPSSEQVEGFFAKLWNWFTGLFKSNNTNVENNVIENAPMDSTIEAPVDNDLLDSMEENSTIEENVVPDNIENNIDELEEELEKEIKTENNVKDNIVENIEENTLENN
jgi:hypothetical protein